MYQCCEVVLGIYIDGIQAGIERAKIREIIRKLFRELGRDAHPKGTNGLEGDRS